MLGFIYELEASVLGISALKKVEESREFITELLIKYNLYSPYLDNADNDELYAYCIGLVVALRETT